MIFDNLEEIFSKLKFMKNIINYLLFEEYVNLKKINADFYIKAYCKGKKEFVF